MRIEGYWRQTLKEKSDLPFPQTQEQPWEGQFEFLADLKSKEKIAKEECYNGPSNCRICHKTNGSTEFNLGDWSWPEGLRHYIEDHNVKPSDDFIAFIMENNQ